MEWEAYSSSIMGWLTDTTKGTCNGWLEWAAFWTFAIVIYVPWIVFWPYMTLYVIWYVFCVRLPEAVRNLRLFF